jgi:hypothetical protein
MPALILSSNYRWAGPEMRVSVVPPNNRFGANEGVSGFGEPRRGHDLYKPASLAADATAPRLTSWLGQLLNHA